jgi:hypothetical protein
MNFDFTEIKIELERCQYVADAKAHYDILAGGLIWEDEMPSREQTNNYLKIVCYLRTIIAYRASLTLGCEREEFRENWNALKGIVPNWPGFKKERIFGKPERLLKIHKYKEDKALKTLEDEL